MKLPETIAACVEAQTAIMDDPSNQLPKGSSIYLYTPAARKKLDAISRHITHLMAVKRAAEGRPIVADGYSGRNCNRRR